MLLSMQQPVGSALRHHDDTVGRVNDFLFDDRNWGVRYAVVQPRRREEQVLVSPSVMVGLHHDEKTVQTLLNEDQVSSAPPLVSDPPVSEKPDTESFNALRSFDEVVQYDVYGTDGKLGQCRDFLTLMFPWRLQSIVVMIPGFLRDKACMLPLWDIKKISFDRKRITLSEGVDELKKIAKPFDPSQPVNRAKGHMFDYYGRPVCKVDAPSTA